MHPAKSVIFFTTASGAGYGMMVWLAVLAWMGVLPTNFDFGLAAFGLALALVTAGLLSSTFHLGHPERAWRALSQWRSSWLSREGVAAILAFIPMGLFALAWVFELTPRGTSVTLGTIGATMALATIYCTAKIYASLRTIPAWHNHWTVAGYLVLGPMNGALVLMLVLLLFGQEVPAALLSIAAMLMLLIGLLVKLSYWRSLDRAAPVSTAGSATGLGHLGRVEMTGSPHDADNYLLREMGFRIVRRHARKLRLISILSGFVAPALCLAVGMMLGQLTLATILSLLALVLCQLGVTAERWLFFAEARHVVTLYYGDQAV